jgi:hypothetical protein
MPAALKRFLVALAAGLGVGLVWFPASFFFALWMWGAGQIAGLFPFLFALVTSVVVAVCVIVVTAIVLSRRQVKTNRV